MADSRSPVAAGGLTQYLVAEWESIRAEAGRTLGLGGDGGATLRPEPEGRHSSARRALDTLASLDRAGGGLPARLSMGDLLGEGGMGVVRVGEQRALHREVAVKGVKPGRDAPEDSLRLLQEAWVTGGLEHPNVVPVYDIGLDAAGAPLIVLKRIRGTPWSELLRDGEAVRERFGEDDLLRWNLEVLAQVCNAVRFAHSRGVLHLDIKPSNVMIGSFGEVYVLDWGLARALPTAEAHRLPRVEDIDEVFGTPSYLAPELLARDGSLVGEHTDVCLLGGVLYELLTGAPPYVAEDVLAILFQAATKEPALPASLPPEIAGICRDALRKEPSERTGSVEAFRLSVLGFLNHRGSARIAEEADARRAELDALLSAVPPSDDKGLRACREAAYAVFGEVRFGYRQALRSWPENAPAREGLVRATAAMVDFALSLDDARAAAALLGELDDPPAELAARVDRALELLSRREANLAELARLREDLDPKIGRRTRIFLIALFGVMWTLVPLSAVVFPDSPGANSWTGFLVAPVFWTVASIALLRWARETMTRTLFNRRMGNTIVFLLAAQAVITWGCMRAGLPLASMFVILPAYWFAISGMVAITLEPRAWPTAVGYAASMVLAAFVTSPRWDWLALCSGHLVMVPNLLVIWWPERLRGWPADPRLEAEHRTLTMSAQELLRAEEEPDA